MTNAEWLVISYGKLFSNLNAIETDDGEYDIVYGPYESVGHIEAETPTAAIMNWLDDRHDKRTWIFTGADIIKCPYCGKRFDVSNDEEDWRFCPVCGSRIDE